MKTALTTLALSGSLALASAQTISNPSFEASSFANYPGYISINFPIMGWTASDNTHAGLNPVSGGIPNPFADNGTVPDGTNVAFIQSLGSISSLSTVISNLSVGETYKVNFRVNARSGLGGTPNLKVSIDGVNIINATIVPVGGTNSYRYFAFDFTAAATNQMMTLINDAGPDQTVLVDNFSIAVRNSGWSCAAWNDDASSGVVATNNYTHAYNFGSTNGATINGVYFTGIAGPNPSTNSFSTAGLPNVFNNDTNNVTGASHQLASDFLWGGAVQSITIKGLVVGKSYRTTLYSVGFENGARAATFSEDNDRLTVNQDQFGTNNGIWVSYYFTATATSNTITYVPLQGSFTFHTYGFCNCEVPPLQIVNPSFEADTFKVGPGYVSDNFPITGWNGVGRYGVNPGNGFGPFTDNGAIPDGTKAAFIQGDTNYNGVLTQTIRGFTNGAGYQLRYFENSRNCCSNVPFAEVRIGGQTIVGPHAVPPVGGGNAYYHVFSDPFVATNSSLELAFIKSDPQGGDNTLLIDNVSISPVISNQAPMVISLAADPVTNNSAQLNGQVNPQGSPTTAWFQWGTDTNYGSLIIPQAVGSGWGFSNLNAVLSGLSVSDYHYRLVASNAFGIGAGADQSFTIPSFYSVSIPGFGGAGSLAWGDFDNDGQLDFLVLGGSSPKGGTSQSLWRNTGSGFTNVPIPGLPGVDSGSVAWGDFDNDGRLDFLITGSTNDGILKGHEGVVSQLWRNTGSGFSNVTASLAPGLPGVRRSSVAWGDFDNDGRLDFLISGATNAQGNGNLITELWRNTGSGFSNVSASVAPGLPRIYDSSVAWGDFDGDGRLDFLFTGYDNTNSLSQLWQNTANGFSNVTASLAPGLPGVRSGSVAWGDFDNDGRLDFLITGDDGTNDISQLWRNTGSGFTNVPIPGVPGVTLSSVAWGDFDNDGRLDFLITGYDGTNNISQLWRNTGSGFTNVPIPGLPGVDGSSVVWGDFDNDGRLDFLGGNFGLWRNNLSLSNAPPAAPASLSATISGTAVILNWNAPADDHTPAAGLNYNVRIGTTPGGSNILAPEALANGTRLVPRIGNAGPGLTASYQLLPGADYYWSVQAVDTSFAGSPFAAEAHFTLFPILFNPVRFGNGVFQLSFMNIGSNSWVVRATTNLALPLASWDNLGLPTPLGGGLYQFSDGLAPNYSRRFYRLQQQ